MEPSEPTLSLTNRLAMVASLLFSVVLGAAVVLFGLSAVGLGRYTTLAAGRGVPVALAGLGVLVAYLSSQYYRPDGA